MKLTDLRKTYPDGTPAVRGIDLDVPEGRFVVFLGPSGCGKTTTLRMIAGLETTTAGTIHIGDREVTDLPASERDVGFVFQFYALYPHMTVHENIAFPLVNQGASRSDRRQRVEEIATRLGIADLLDRHPGQLSGGDQQRVSLARAMVREPHIYLMDEPLGQLDASIRLQLREAIKAQQTESGITTVYVTHDQEEALSLGDLVVVMNEGRIEQTGTPDEIYSSPDSLFVADFVGSPGMNTLAGPLERRDGQTWFGAAGSFLPIPDTDVENDVILGIRPEFVTLDGESGLPGRVAVSEYFGDHHIIHVASELGTIHVRATRGRSRGDAVRLTFETDRIRLYDPETGRRFP